MGKLTAALIISWPLVYLVTGFMEFLKISGLVSGVTLVKTFTVGTIVLLIPVTIAFAGYALVFYFLGIYGKPESHNKQVPL